MKKYESPIVIFEKVTLFERIADNCWMGKSFYFDWNNNDIKDGSDTFIAINKTETSSSCSATQGDVLGSVESYLNGIDAGDDWRNWKNVSGVKDEETLNNTTVKNIGFSSK